MAEDMLNKMAEKEQAVLVKKKRELADLDADLDEFMNVAADGNYNLKILNDAFAGKAHENEEVDLVYEGDEVKLKKKTKRPPKPETKTKPDKKIEKRDPRLDAIVEEVMRQSASDFKKIDFDAYAVEQED